VLGAHLLLQLGHAVLQPGFGHRPLHYYQQLVVGVALGEVVEGTFLHGPHAIGDGAVGGQQNNFGQRGQGAQAGQQGHAVGIGQLHIAEDDQHLGGVLAQQLQAVAGVGGLPHGIALKFEHPRHYPAQAGLVINK
jgi:hypothetical protein